MDIFNFLQEVQIPFHSTIEAFGSAIAITIALIFFITQHKKGNGYQLWIVLAFIATGVFDLFHAISQPGNNFVWLHSLAVFMGGLFFVLIWLPNNINSRVRKIFPVIIAVFSVGVSTFSFIYPKSVLQMLVSNNFSVWAIYLNVIGGLLFLAAIPKLIIIYQKNKAKEAIVLAILSLFFGIAGIVFKYSSLWDFQWWLWHFIRLFAYFGILLIIFYELKRQLYAYESMRQLTQILKEISIGKFDLKIEQDLLESKDEVGELARAFDRTIISLKLAMREQKPVSGIKNQDSSEEENKNEILNT